MASIISWHVLWYYNRNGYRSTYGDDSIDSKRRNDGTRNEFAYAIINGLYPAFLCIHIHRTCNWNSNRNRYEKVVQSPLSSSVLFVAIRVPVVRKFD